MKIFLVKINSCPPPPPPHVTDRPYCQATEPTSALSSSKDNNEEKTSAGFVTVF